MTHVVSKESQMRRKVLLRAAFDFLKELDKTLALDALSLSVFYDGTECDGVCLMEDIAHELKIEEVEK